MTRWTMGILALAACLFASGKQPVMAQACDSGTFEGAFDVEVLLPQNWNCEERQEFWFTDQGSQIIPYAWFLNLEQAGSQDKFSDPANMNRYRYLPQKPTGAEPGRFSRSDSPEATPRRTGSTPGFRRAGWA